MNDMDVSAGDAERPTNRFSEEPTMDQTAGNGSKKQRATPDRPYHVSHESFEEKRAALTYGPETAGREDYAATYMPDDVTRDLSRRMHYAAWRAARAGDERTRLRRHRTYLDFRDRIVVGNRKLIYRAVRRWMPPSAFADDMVGDCQIVLIQAVSAYNPWMGIRFSTYAFTCLMRALTRLSQRHAASTCPGRSSAAARLDSLPDGRSRATARRRRCRAPADMACVDEFLRAGNDLAVDVGGAMLARQLQPRRPGARAGTSNRSAAQQWACRRSGCGRCRPAHLGKVRAAEAG